MRSLSVVLLLVMLTGCAAVGKSLVISGESLVATGEQFVAVAKVYKQGCDVTKTISVTQCAKFAAFGEKFKQTYPLAAGVWYAARSSGDAAAEKQARAVIVDLATDLSALAVQGIGVFGGNK